MSKPDTSPEVIRALADAVSDLYNVTVRTGQITSETLRAVADEKEASKWLPIETAPLWTDVLLWVGRVAVGSLPGEDCCSLRCEWKESDLDPTHWMPLPEGPKT